MPPPSISSVSPGDPAGGVAGEEQGGVGDVLGLARAGAVGMPAATASSVGSHRARAKSVFTSPGAMPLTRTLGASSAASWLVRWMTAALVTL